MNQIEADRIFKPEKAFIGLCIAIAGCDEKIDLRQLNKLREVTKRNGIFEEDVIRELDDFSKMNIEEALIYGRRCMAALPELESEMKNMLLLSLYEIALADSDYHQMELKVIETVKKRMEFD